MANHDPLVPDVGEEDAPFWEWTRKHELRMQECQACGHGWWPPSSVCPECWSEDIDWIRLSGDGTVNSWVVFHQRYYAQFEDEIPYNVAEIELEENRRYLANIVECENDEIYRGMEVEVVFDDITDEITLPRFRPK